MSGLSRLSIVALTLLLSSAGAMAENIAVTIKNLKFVPAEVSVHVGDTITWTDQDFIAHTSTARSKDWDSTVAPGKSASVDVEKAGDFHYFCRFHPNMTATVTAAN